jgi:predicted MPP superfamily phosphohydrolase
MARIAHISDLHCRGRQDANACIESGMEKLQLDLRPADLLVVTGDVTNNGREDEYAEARRLLAPFVGQLLLAPGNHDDGTLGLLWFSGARKRWTGLVRELLVPSVAQVGACLVAGFDSVRHTVSPFDTARQNLGGTERKKLEAFLRTASDKGMAPVVAFHGSTLDDSPFELLLDRAEVKKLLARRATYCLMGHEHARRRLVEDGVTYISAPSFREHPQPIWVEAG